jgi:hypothetical protein
MEQKDDPLHKPPEFRRLIVINGPPRVGKDTAQQYISRYVREHMPFSRPMTVKLSEPLKRAAHALYNVFHNWDYYDGEGKSQKGLAVGDFLGLSPRQAYIEMSNKLIEMHGPEVLGFLARKVIVRHNSTSVFIVDCGMVEELRPLINLVGQRGTCVIEIHAADRSFENDSRGYIADKAKAEFPHITTFKIPNVFGDAADKEFFRVMCEGAVKKFLGIREDGD